MPELPEVEITARRLHAALQGAEVESVLSPGMVALKTFDPPFGTLVGMRVTGVGRRGKMLEVGFVTADEAPPEERLSLLVHLMSAGRLQLFDKRASLRDKASRLLIRLTDDRELRLREFGSKQRAWGKLLREGEVENDEMVSTLGPEAWPAPSLPELAKALDQPRLLHPLLRDQRAIAGIGRQWADEILWRAKLSPFKRGADLSDDDVADIYDALAVLGEAINHYEEVIGAEPPNKMPLPLKVHKQEGNPCERCGTQIEAVFYSEHQVNYCPAEQTGGKVMKDRRLSKLLK